MKNEEQPNRFGTSPDDPQNLVKAWHETRPAVADTDWAPLWQSAVGRAASAPVTEGHGGLYYPVRLALAASLLVAAWVGWQALATPEANTPGEMAIASQSLTKQALAESIPHLVKIDLQEADDLAIIRLDDQQCTADAPCLETVEADTAQSGGTAIASNFQLFNDLESIANDLR
ncbi:MAG: hypothetical protein ACKO85_10890 [Isosphaeraceae bacterium]